MTFTPVELDLLSHSCYGDPRLPQWLERMPTEGPGDDDWLWDAPSGWFSDEDLPLHERVWSQIWHQGTIYPASYVAVPVLVDVIERFPQGSFSLVGHVSLIEESRRLFRPTNSPDLAELPEAIQQKYHAALLRLADLIPSLLRALPPTVTKRSLDKGIELLRCLALLSGQPLLGRLTSDIELISFEGEVHRSLLQFEEHTGDSTFSERLRADHQRRQESSAPTPPTGSDDASAL